MFKIKYFVIVSCLMSTAASAAIVIDNAHHLSPEDKEKAFGVLIKRKHDVEDAVQINNELAATLPNKNLNAYWVPDTLYQVIQSYFDVWGIKGSGEHMAKQADIAPNDWKKGKKNGGIFRNAHYYPTTLTEHKALAPHVVEDWARFNTLAHLKLRDGEYLTRGSQHALTKIFEAGPTYQNAYERRGFNSSDMAQRLKLTSYLKKNENFLKHALHVEEEAHKNGKLLFWRYTSSLTNAEIPDLPFKIQENDLGRTLGSPLEYQQSIYFEHSNRYSYAGRLLDGFFGDGHIDESPYARSLVPACTFSFIANNLAAQQNGHNLPNPIVYSLALLPEEIKKLNDKLYLYHPREAVPQHVGIYGMGEGFHPSWLFDYKNKENVEAWLGLMKSKALQVHLIKGVLQADHQNNAEAQRLRDIYGQFLNKAHNEEITVPQDIPVAPPAPPPVAVAPVVHSPVVAPVVHSPVVAPVVQPQPAPVPKTHAKKSKTSKVKKVRAPKVKKVRVQKVKKVRAQKVKRVRVQKVKKVRVQKVKKVRVQKVKKVRVQKVKKVRVLKVKKSPSLRARKARR